MAPLFALGRIGETVTSAPLGVGSTFVEVSRAEEFFYANVPIFISRADDSDIDFLGFLVKTGENSIVTSLAARSAKPMGSKIWGADRFFNWMIPPAPPAERKIELGVKNLTSVGGKEYSVKIRPTGFYETLNFDMVHKSVLDSYISWISDALSGGLHPFTYVSQDREVFGVRLMQEQSPIVFKNGGLSEISVSLDILGPGRYI